MRNTAHARIDLSALRDNLAVVRSLCPHSRILAMVKADAYGHGLLPVVGALDASDGFAVARLEEALALRDAGISKRIVLLGTLLDSADLTACSQRNIDVTAHDESSVSAIASHVKCKSLRVWLKLDSGMHRIGLSPEAFIAADRQLSNHPGVVELIHMTHFSSADHVLTTVVDRQISRFLECRKAASASPVSLANSAALIRRPDTHADWVRPGIMLYGANPLGTRHPLPLRAAMTLCACIIAVRTVGPGESVGYNESWTSTRPSRIATVGIGYGDGYPRHAPTGTPVWINGQVAPLVGRVSMDSLSVDVTTCEHATVGDEAMLWGPELPAAVIAECAQTISYQLFASLRERVSRQYGSHEERPGLRRSTV